MEFTGKEVADAIHAAREYFHVSREDLQIEVLDTGSSGIFGLIRKKARIRAGLRRETLETVAAVSTFSQERHAEPPPAKERLTEPQPTESPASASSADREPPGETPMTEVALPQEEQTVSPENQAIVRDILGDMLRLMGMPSIVETNADGPLVTCTITGPFESELISQDGRVIDSLQYFLRKIAAKRCPEQLRIAVNVGDFRERRLERLRAMAEQLAGEVRQTGKTRIIPALNPAERREIHLLLQNDPEVRSRSVGDGVFKRVLIFKLGRSGKTEGRRPAKRPAG